MKNAIIGIDIDGVLNKHREKFCEDHMRNMKNRFNDEQNIPEGLKLIPDDITNIPVSQIKGKDITTNDEYDVFNNTNYWNNQSPIDEDVSKIIQELKNSFGYKINIHSYRPWPQYTYGSIDHEVLKEDWKAKSLTKITEEWLDTHNIPKDNLFIEKSSVDSTKRSLTLFGLLFGIGESQFKNRFYYTNKKSYRYFVEDTPENAIKLSSSCDFVFLIEHPYNNEVNFSQDLPINVIRVKNWSEIKNKIKELG